MKKIVFVLVFLTSLASISQNEDALTSEIGLDGSFYTSNLGGAFGIGAKYGWNINEYVIAGPSARFQRSWSQPLYTTTTASANIFGGGGFLHARFFNALFLGVELELLRSPYFNFGGYTNTSRWALTGFIGGGFSMEVNEKWRLNLGIMYDAINSQNSPLRTQYFMRNSLGQLLPVIYRVTFFFPLGREKDDTDME